MTGRRRRSGRRRRPADREPEPELLDLDALSAPLPRPPALPPLPRRLRAVGDRLGRPQPSGPGGWPTLNDVAPGAGERLAEALAPEVERLRRREEAARRRARRSQE